jgi:DNA-binding transcriptional regulator YbjK
VRRTTLLDTALQVLAEHGMRGLTHRAVDRAAGLPDGSTSYYFRTRDALVTGCLRRLLELDRTAVPADPGPLDVDLLTDRAVEAGVRMVTDGAPHTLARYELSLHVVRTPALRAELVEMGDQLRGLIAVALAALGVSEARQAAEELAAVMDGLVFTALVRGPREPEELRAWLRPPLHRTLSAYLTPD